MSNRTQPRLPGRLRAWPRRLAVRDEGMSTAEYAIGTIAAAAFAALLYTVVTGDNVLNELTSLVQQALTTEF
ncbi:DUF4244 domain-containing protein [Amycolatopsis cihanbeyliensis]|uniref:DUF4244 domain-containing protein n=1 Tax=Amycolatopsis cihanbeyliensis TaxID=1128664 RepID=UPI0011540029|nr:DUF4244 domain-containing protein [Amycolatopsis cihanbeyliensis]